MGAGYFGKLAARADFVTANCPAGFMRLWEPFLMKGLAQSRLDLIEAWEEAYMTMPVWRFWLTPAQEGSELGVAVAGAFMPSIDKVGREFPLTVVAPTGTGLNGSPNSDWYDNVEDLLLKTLEEEATLEAFQSGVKNLEAPVDLNNVFHGVDQVALDAAPDTGEHLLSQFRCQAGDRPIEFSCRGLPDAGAFRWLILPEQHKAESGQEKAAGENHGRYHPEDHRT
ncbi:type VI secretion system-associated protein TagF [uncultured Roseibium sp.]|uniref:type VI secretion system-associated protein TagF n=1 Tax=uncultured Roseibium sp. TaxID=1936171 RepID=UPI002636A893|nr:type VI secretion system-associated protein TagF [uncultured Roseibium sp.]